MVHRAGWEIRWFALAGLIVGCGGTNPPPAESTIVSVKPLIDAGAPDAGPAVACHYAPVPSQAPSALELVVLIDMQAMIDDENRQRTRQAIEQLVDDLKPDDRFALVAFESAPLVVVPLVPTGGSDDRETIKVLVRRLRAVARQSNPTQALKRAYLLFSDAPVTRRHVILISNDAPPDDLVDVTAEIHQEGISVSTLVFPDSAHESFAEVARVGQGCYRRIDDDANLSSLLWYEVVGARGRASTATKP